MIRVMSEAMEPPPAETIQPPPYSSTSTTVENFNSYRVSKRPATAVEGNLNKKANRLDYQHDVHDVDYKMES